VRLGDRLAFQRLRKRRSWPWIVREKSHRAKALKYHAVTAFRAVFEACTSHFAKILEEI